MRGHSISYFIKYEIIENPIFKGYTSPFSYSYLMKYEI